MMMFEKDDENNFLNPDSHQTSLNKTASSIAVQHRSVSLCPPVLLTPSHWRVGGKGLNKKQKYFFAFSINSLIITNGKLKTEKINSLPQCPCPDDLILLFWLVFIENTQNLLLIGPIIQGTVYLF